MTEALFVPLPHRAPLQIAGVDARAFLQGLISNDVDRLAADRALWAAFLSPQGKYLHDFFVCEHDGALLLEAEAARLADLSRRLSPYRLRSKVTIAPPSAALAVWAAFGPGVAGICGLPETPGAARPFAGGLLFTDPRRAEAGVRAILPEPDGAQALVDLGLAAGDFGRWDRHRIALGLPDGSRDMLVDKSLLLECGFDELHGVDWDKGCYLGQELTARTRYRGLVKKRLLPVEVDGPLPAPGTAIEIDGREAGEVRSGVEGIALALLRLDVLDRAEAPGGVLVGDARLTARRPDWLAL